MTKKIYSRREFIRRNSLAGTGLLLGGFGVAPAIFSPRVSEASDPAVLGGRPLRSEEWPGWPQWEPERDEPLLLEVMRSGVWSRAGKVAEFEEKWAETVGSRRCVTTVNGTNALICALANLDVGAGDEVILPTYTFIACPQSILLNGAMPVFADIDPETFQIDVEKLGERITSRTKAIMPVHIGGYPCDMPALMEVAARHNLYVVEDACQAWLAEIDGKQAGTFGDAGCYSFQNSKNIPIGEGGAIVSDDDAFIDRCYSYHNFGNPYRSIQGAPGSGTLRLGTKMRMSEYQAAIGLSQLGQFERQTDIRNANAEYLAALLDEIMGIESCRIYDNVTRLALHLFLFRYRKEEFAGMHKNEFRRALAAEGIPCSTGYAQLNRMPYLADAFSTEAFRRIWPEEMLDFDRYLERNHCPQNDRICLEEGMWFTHRMLLGDRSDMEQIAAAILKIQQHSSRIRRELEG